MYLHRYIHVSNDTQIWESLFPKPGIPAVSTAYRLLLTGMEFTRGNFARDDFAIPCLTLGSFELGSVCTSASPVPCDLDPGFLLWLSQFVGHHARREDSRCYSHVCLFSKPFGVFLFPFECLRSLGWLFIMRSLLKSPKTMRFLLSSEFRSNEEI